MNKRQATLAVFMTCLALWGCAPQMSIPTPFPTLTSLPTITPTATATATIASSATATVPATETTTPLPPPVCNPGTTVESAVDNSLPGYIDILSVSTKLKGSTLTAVFTLSWLPNEILINRSILAEGSREIAWGVAIDTDNDPATGGASFFTDSGYGYEYILQALNYKQGEEKLGDLESLFEDQTSLWEAYADGTSRIYGTGNIKLNESKGTLTLSANVSGISKNSYLHFFAVYYPNTRPLTDEICKR